MFRSDYDVVIMPNYVHIYLFSGASQQLLSAPAKMETFPNNIHENIVTLIIQIRNSCRREIHTIKLSSKFIINKLRALIVGMEI